MTIRSITSEDLSILEKYFEKAWVDENIQSLSMNKSFIATDDDNVVSILLLKKHSLLDYFAGSIPKDKNTPEGWNIENHIAEASMCFDDEEYEIVNWYAKDNDIKLFGHIYAEYTQNNDMLIWKKYISDDVFYSPHFYNLNNQILVDIPPTD